MNDASVIYRAAQRLARAAAAVVLPDVAMEGTENLPPNGPYIVVANHQSILDPILIQGFCPPPLHTMAKSTQFAVPGFAWLLKQLNAFPARRYQIDPQVVRIALRRLDAGHAVGVYIEGERSWDGRLQAPRLGTLRLILKAGVPVVPCAIRGSYAAWPRWDRAIRREPIRIAFGTPEHFPQLDRREERERLLDDVGATLMARIRQLLHTPDPTRRAVHASDPTPDRAR